MIDFTPIPGVWYEDEEYDQWLFLPASYGYSDAWFRRRNGYGSEVLELDRNRPRGKLTLVHNPHPPTRTEWAVCGKSRLTDTWVDMFIHGDRERVVEYFRRLSAQGERVQMFKRSSQVTEWVEVTE